MATTLFIIVLVSILFLFQVNAESHTVTFNNKCGYGYGALVLGGVVVFTGNNSGQTYTSNGPLSGIAYFQNGNCNLNGEGCPLVEMTLINPVASTPGSGSSVDISLIPPHAYTVPNAFSYTNGCDGTGASCNSPTCGSAFFNPDDTQVQVACETADNVGLIITFCGDDSSAAAAPTTPVTAPTSLATPSATPTTIDVNIAQGTSIVPTSKTHVATTSPTPTPTTGNPPKCKARHRPRPDSDISARHPRALRAHRRRAANNFLH